MQAIHRPALAAATSVSQVVGEIIWQVAVHARCDSRRLQERHLLTRRIHFLNLTTGLSLFFTSEASRPRARPPGASTASALSRR